MLDLAYVLQSIFSVSTFGLPAPVQMLISGGVLCPTAGVSCDAAAAGETFYARKPDPESVGGGKVEIMQKRNHDPVLLFLSSTFMRRGHVRLECRN